MLDFFCRSCVHVFVIYLIKDSSPNCLFSIIGNSGGGTSKNRALGDTFLKLGMLLGQTMRSSKTTGYKLAHAPGGP